MGLGRRVAISVGVLASLLPLAPAAADGGPPAPARVIDGRVDDWVGRSSLLAGRTALSSGELIYQDHLYDDHGAGANDPRAEQRQILEPTRGRVRYPTDATRYGPGVADLFQLRLALEGERVVLLARLDALKAADTTVVSVAFDVDGPGDRARRSWPHASGLTAEGADVVVTAWGTGADVVDLRSGRRTRLGEVAADPGANAIEVALPRSLLPGQRWRLWAATGLWDPATNGFHAIDGTPPTDRRPGYGGLLGSRGRAFNVAFRDRETGTYLEDRQAAALQTGDVTPFAAGVSVERLARGQSDPVPTLRAGEQQVVLVDEGTTIGPGEGASWTGIDGRQGGNAVIVSESPHFEYFGRYQPYLVYVPKGYDASTPIPSALVLHGRGGTHSSFNRQPGFVRDLGERPGLPAMALISPLARGESFYVDHGERSVLLALDDAASRLRLDPDRQYVTGYSMGGYGALRMAVRYPDRWAAAVSWAGFSGEFLGTGDLTELSSAGDPLGLRSSVIGPIAGMLRPGSSRGIEAASVNGSPAKAVGSLLHVPLLQLGGTNDEIVLVTGQMVPAARMQGLGYRHRFDLYPGYEHLTFALLDDWAAARDYLGDRRRVRDPRRVVFATSPAWVDPRVARDVDLPEPSAWWVSGLEVRAGRDDVHQLGRVDAVSQALPGEVHRSVDRTEAALSPLPNVRLGTEWIPTGPEPIRNVLELRLSNLSAVTVDVRAARIVDRCRTVVVVTDGPTTITLRGSATSPIVVPRAGTTTLRTDCAARG